MTLNTFSPQSIFIRPEGLPKLSSGSSIIVIGAGAFGGWTALSLIRKGLKVTLVDAWGAGNSRSSSGDDTRVIRSTYGANEFYFDLNVRALKLWQENERHWNRQLFFNTGVLWFCYQEKTPLVDDSIPFAQKHNMPYEYLSVADVKKRFPNVNTTDLHHAWFDPYGGYLKARESCLAVKDAFVKEGGTYHQSMVKPGRIQSGSMRSILMSGLDHSQAEPVEAQAERSPRRSAADVGVEAKADAYLFACGSWMGQIFPEVLGDVITCTRQEVLYFGVPQSESVQYDNLPVWVDVDGQDFYYGIPGNAQRGFKIGVDRRGKKFDPTSDDRSPDPQVLDHARKFISHRFPGLKGAPLIESRVCPYENSPDGNFIFDKHPEAGNVIFLGGGSGHGFKHGPALGEYVANALVG